MASRLIVGCGYVGTRAAQRWLENGDSVFAITRSRARAAEFIQLGIEPVVWDWLVGGLPAVTETFQKSRQKVDAFDTILIAVSHAPQVGVAHKETHTRGLNNLHDLLNGKDLITQSAGYDLPSHGRFTPLENLLGTQTKWLYLSTTGVFGSCNPGDWVDEETNVSPERPGSIAAWAGEQWIATHIPSERRMALRPVGIYGPGRVPQWQSIRDQRALQVDPESFLNLIHIEDLTTAIVKLANTKMKSTLYCLSDGEPVQRRDYYECIAQLGSWPKPVFAGAKQLETETVGRRSDGNKRVRNRKIQSEIAMAFQFPSYREGLSDLFANSNHWASDGYRAS